MENGTQHAFARRGSDQGLATWQQRFAAWEGGRGMRTSDPKERVRADIGVFCLERMEGGAEGGVQIPVAKEHVRAHWAYGWARHGRVVGVEEGALGLWMGAAWPRCWCRGGPRPRTPTRGARAHTLTRAYTHPARPARVVGRVHEMHEQGGARGRAWPDAHQHSSVLKEMTAPYVSMTLLAAGRLPLLYRKFSE